MAEAVRLLVAGLPAEIVREIGLRLRGVTVTEFENAQQMGRAASQGEAALVILSDVLPAQDSIYVARRARDANDNVRIAYCISMTQAEAALHALKEINVDRFFLSPVDIEEMVRELAKMGRLEVLAPQASHGVFRIERRVIRVSLAHYLDDPHDSRFRAGMIKEGEVALLHLVAHEVARLIISYAIPVGGVAGLVPEIIE